MARLLKSTAVMMTARRSTRFTACLFALLTVAFASPALGSDSHSDDDRPGVFIVGDSHVEMLGPTLRNRMSEHGLRVLGYESRRGWSTMRYHHAGDLCDLLVAAGRPEVVVVSLGGNDVIASADAYEEHLRWVVEQARAAGAREIVWLGPASSEVTVSERAAVVGARHERNAQWQRELLPALGVRWIDSRPFTLEHHARDGVHFDRTGYSTWAGAVLPEVEATVLALAPAEPLARDV